MIDMECSKCGKELLKRQLKTTTSCDEFDNEGKLIAYDVERPAIIDIYECEDCGIYYNEDGEVRNIGDEEEVLQMPRWTEKQLKEFWEKETKESKRRYGYSYKEWKKDIIHETD